MTQTLTMKRCTFCCNTENQADVLVSGPMVWICDNCVVLCVEMIASLTPIPMRKLFAQRVVERLEPVMEMIRSESDAEQR